MGSVTTTETIGGISKSIYFSSYEDFKDWESRKDVVYKEEEPQQALPDSEGWIVHDTEHQPVGDDIVVEVRWKRLDGDILNDRGFASDIWWSEPLEKVDRISHYRIIPEPEQED